MQNILNQIDQNLHDPELSVDSLSKSSFLSRSQLFRVVKAATGLAPSELIAQKRLEKAAELLKDESDLPVHRVAERTGFADAAYFSRLFKKHFGKKPSDLRDSRKKNGG